MQFFVAFNILFKRTKAIRFMLKDKAVPFRKKLLVIFGLIYIILPFGLIPIVIFPIAWLDDLILWIWIMWYLRDTLDKYWMGDTKDYAGKFKSKKVIDNVEYEVKEEQDEPRSKE